MGTCCLSQIARYNLYTRKQNKHRFHYKYLLICQEATNIFTKKEQHDINRLYNGIKNKTNRHKICKKNYVFDFFTEYLKNVTKNFLF